MNENTFIWKTTPFWAEQCLDTGKETDEALLELSMLQHWGSGSKKRMIRKHKKCAIIPPKCTHFRAVNAAALGLELEEEKDKSPQTGLEMFLHTKSVLQNVQLFLQNVHIFELLTLQHWGSGSKKGKIKNKWEDVMWPMLSQTVSTVNAAALRLRVESLYHEGEKLRTICRWQLYWEWMSTRQLYLNLKFNPLSWRGKTLWELQILHRVKWGLGKLSYKKNDEKRGHCPLWATPP